jgi:hypothetical protein
LTGFLGTSSQPQGLLLSGLPLRDSR